MRGVGLDFVVLDEFADIDPNAWYEVLRPTLSDTGGHALFIGTPKGFNWAKDLYDNQQTKENWASFQFTTIDGGRVPLDEIEQARQDLDERTFRQEYLATFETYSGIIAYAFGQHNIAPCTDFKPTSQLLVGLDFNVNPMSAVVMIRTEHGLHAVGEIVIHNSNTTEFVEELRRRYPTNPITIFPDPAGVQRKTSANGNTDIKILEQAGFTVKYHRSHPLVRDRINSANSLFQRRDTHQRFLIDPTLKHTIKSLNNYSYKEGTQLPDKDSGWDHLFDALTYCIQYLYPIRVETEQREPERFGVR